MKRIGILGGTFDPVHNGHLKLAENASHQFPLDCIWFMPAYNPPHKTDHFITGYEDRMAMVKLAIKPYPEFVCSDFESKRGGKSYTAETLTELIRLYPDTEFSFILGADSFYEIATWYHPETVMRISDLIVADRDYDKNRTTLTQQAEYLKTKYGARVGFIRAEEIDISSEHIRKMLHEDKKKAEEFIPPTVSEYIKEHHLYHGQG